MSRSKLWVSAWAVGWLAAAASVHADAVVPASAAGADTQTVAEAPAEAPALDAQAQADAMDSAASTAAEPVSPATPVEEGATPAPNSEAVAEQPPAALEPEGASDATTASGEATDAPDSAPPLGAIGYDSEGRAGRIHIVVRGDTLWDISDAYLGTPWVWPSIWRDNGEIENPHRIFPGDHIWITPSEMRKISAEEAALLLANRPQSLDPAAPEQIAPVADLAPAAPEAVAEPTEQSTLRVSNRETTGLITAEQFEASGSVVGRVPGRLLMSQEDQVYIGVGESEVAVGDELTLFRTNGRVFDPDTGRLLGYHVDFLGWLEVLETHPESSLARIRMSTGEIEEGDRVIPREPLPAEIALQPSPADVEGKISFFPQKRVVIGWNDFVYLNRGTTDGLEVGSPLEVFRPGYETEDPARDEKVAVPDRVIAKLVVVRTADESSVALITKTETELQLGDRFRGRQQTN